MEISIQKALKVTCSFVHAAYIFSMEWTAFMIFMKRFERYSSGQNETKVFLFLSFKSYFYNQWRDFMLKIPC